MGRVPRTSAESRWGPDTATAWTAVVGIAFCWVALKLMSVWAWVVLPGEYGDTYYYFLGAQEAFAAGNGVRDAFTEYPTPAGALLLLPYALGYDDYESYRTVTVALTSTADAAFALLLGRRTGPAGVLAWLAVTTIAGQVALLRLDLLAAAAAGAAVLYALAGRSRTASVLVAVGTGLKLWPLVLAPLTLLAERGRRGLAIAWFVGTGALIVAGSLVAGGWDRLLSPLDYQTDRGLQIESVPATLPMHEWAARDGYRVWYSAFHAFEVEGPTVAAWLDVGRIAGVVALLGCLVLVGRWVWNGCDRGALGYLALTFVAAFIVTSRALSPQYLLWLAAPAVAVFASAWAGRPDDPGTSPPTVRDRVLAAVTLLAVLALTLLTTAIYPVFYGGLTGINAVTPRALALLAARNLGLLALVVWTAFVAWISSAPQARHGADERLRAGERFSSA